MFVPKNWIKKKTNQTRQVSESLHHKLWLYYWDVIWAPWSLKSPATRQQKKYQNSTVLAFARGIHRFPLRWRHNDHAGVSNHQPHGCLLNRLFRRNSKKTSKLRVTGLCAGNSPGTGEFPAQMASYAENVSIWWRHHATHIDIWGFKVKLWFRLGHHLFNRARYIFISILNKEKQYAQLTMVAGQVIVAYEELSPFGIGVGLSMVNETLLATQNC